MKRKSPPLVLEVSSNMASVVYVIARCVFTYNVAHSHVCGFVTGVNRALSFGPWLKGLNATSISRKAAATVSSAIELEYSLLQVATNDFSVENLVGEGGFGCVYKAQLDDKTVAAVKKLDGDSKQGEREFQVGRGILGQALKASYGAGRSTIICGYNGLNILLSLVCSQRLTL